MPDTKISGLGSVTGAQVSSSIDVFPIVATATTTTKKITAQALFDAQNTLATVTSSQVSQADVVNVYSVSAGASKIITLAEVGKIISHSPITNSLAADVSLASSANYYTGPTVAQGTVGTWFASGSVSLIDSGPSPNYRVKLWDGTTVIASAIINHSLASGRIVVALSGYITSPAGNIRISVRNTNENTGTIVSNDSTEGKDSTLTAFRIA